jgi:hypothetical protein
MGEDDELSDADAPAMEDTQQAQIAHEPEKVIKAYVFTGSGDRPTIDSLVALVEQDVLDSAIRLATGPFGAIGAVIEEGTDQGALENVLRKLQAVRDRINPPPIDSSISLKTATPSGPIIWKGPIGGRSDEGTDASTFPARPADEDGYKWPIGAFVRITTKVGAAQSVLKELPAMQGFWAAAIVSGTYDILLELGTDTYNEMRGILANGLVVSGKPITGVLSSVSCISVNPVQKSHMLRLLARS